MTQLEQAKQAVARLKKNIEDAEALGDLYRIIAAAQNRPPQGEADGSIDAVTWNTLRGLEQSARQVLREFDWLRNQNGWT